MASFIYNSCLEDLALNNIDFGADTFKVILVTSSYAANKDTHDRRDDVTNEVSGTGYTSGGLETTCAVAKDTANDRTTLTFSPVSWSTSTLTARGAVIYKSRGGSAGDDELIAYIDFGSNVSSSGTNFNLSQSIITLQN